MEDQNAMTDLYHSHEGYMIAANGRERELAVLNGCSEWAWASHARGSRGLEPHVVDLVQAPGA